MNQCLKKTNFGMWNLSFILKHLRYMKTQSNQHFRNRKFLIHHITIKLLIMCFFIINNISLNLYTCGYLMYNTIFLKSLFTASDEKNSKHFVDALLLLPCLHRNVICCTTQFFDKSLISGRERLIDEMKGLQKMFKQCSCANV